MPGRLDANMSVDDKDREGTDAAANGLNGVRKHTLRSSGKTVFVCFKNWIVRDLMVER